MARTKTSLAKPAPTTYDVTHMLGAAKPASCGDAHTVLARAYGDEVASKFASAGCKRLPRHEVTELQLMNLKGLSPNEFVAQLQEALRRALAHDAVPSPRATS